MVDLCDKHRYDDIKVMSKSLHRLLHGLRPEPRTSIGLSKKLLK